MGAPAPLTARLPAVPLPLERQRIVFRWTYDEPGFSARGDGVARVAPPDSVRLDFFLDGGFGGGWAALVGADLRTPDANLARRLVPSPTLLWAALGRLDVPAASDTVLRIVADTVRADIRAGANTWRVTVAGRVLVRVERLQNGRVVERLTRNDGDARYDDLVGRRALAITGQRRERATAFPATVWTR